MFRYLIPEIKMPHSQYKHTMTYYSTSIMPQSFLFSIRSTCQVVRFIIWPIITPNCWELWALLPRGWNMTQFCQLAEGSLPLGYGEDKYFSIVRGPLIRSSPPVTSRHHSHSPRRNDQHDGHRLIQSQLHTGGNGDQLQWVININVSL